MLCRPAFHRCLQIGQGWWWRWHAVHIGKKVGTNLGLCFALTTSFPMQLAFGALDFTIGHAHFFEHAATLIPGCFEASSSPTRRPMRFVVINRDGLILRVLPAKGQGTAHGTARMIAHDDGVRADLNVGKANRLAASVVILARRLRLLLVLMMVVHGRLSHFLLRRVVSAQRTVLLLALHLLMLFVAVIAKELIVTVGKDLDRINNNDSVRRGNRRGTTAILVVGAARSPEKAFGGAADTDMKRCKGNHTAFGEGTSTHPNVALG